MDDLYTEHVSAAGWYPDPSGQSGMFRYWTGTAWTAAVTADPSATPPPSAEPRGGGNVPGASSTGFTSGTAYAPTGSSPSASSFDWPTYDWRTADVWPTGSSPSASSFDPSGYDPGPIRPPKRQTGWIIGLVAVLVVVAVVVAFVLPQLAGVIGPIGPGPANPTPDRCAPASSTAPSPMPGQTFGRVYGGTMSYQRLGDPWSAPTPDNRIPFSPVAYQQTVLDHENYAGLGSNWVSAVLIAELWVGDGFGSTKQGAETVFNCVLGKYYSDTPVESTTVISAAHLVDGYDGWLIVADLSFTIPNLPVTGERATILVVATDPENQGYSLFYSSIPDDQKHLQADADAALAGLRVGI